MGRRWKFYESEMGADVVAKEIVKCRLNRFEKVRLEGIMRRAAEGSLYPKDSKHLGDGLMELRLDGDNRIFRLFYAEVEDDGPVLLGLKFINKKSTQGIATPPDLIATARKRLADWQKRANRDQSDG